MNETNNATETLEQVRVMATQYEYDARETGDEVHEANYRNIRIAVENELSEFIDTEEDQ